MRYLLKLMVLSTSLSLTACSSLLSSVSDDLAQNLRTVILNHNDPKTVVSAIPAYLLLQEALIKQQPENARLALSLSTLYRSYAALIPKDKERLKALTEKAFEFGLRGACLHKKTYCQLEQLPFTPFESLIQQSTVEDLNSLYTVGTAWASWIQAHKTDMNAVAQLAQVKTIMMQLVKLDEGYQYGAGHLYLAVLESLLPPALGGKPDVAKQHFEQAIKLSENKNLMVKVLYAKHYARLLFDRKLHDRLLNQVVKADAKQDNLNLINLTAKQQAKQLLESADDYF
ncbi:MAG: TRAP transporter TatT component family protein [Methylococcales bacterium]|nr:TRAP transporter TatT component family protein [Methylococcales bacterium]